MNPRQIVAALVAGLVLGLLAGYLFWGQQARTVATELADVKGRLGTATQQLAEQTRRVDALQAETEGKLKQADAQLKTVAEELSRERELRKRLEALVSKGRK